MGVNTSLALTRKEAMHTRILTKNGWRSQYIIDRNNELKKEHKLFYDNLKYKNNKYQIAKKFLKEEDVCYVYFLFYFSELVYIGKSVNPDSRITAHSFKHNLIRTIKTTNSLAEKWEIKLIEKYQPTYNKFGIKYLKAYYLTKKKFENTYIKIRLQKNRKINLNIKFNKELISDVVCKNKISHDVRYSRDNYYNLKQFLNVYPDSKYYFILEKNKIYFYNYKPKEVNVKLITKNFNL